jgi:CubicO group peptidase (beta-lactamase class C family)
MRRAALLLCLATAMAPDAVAQQRFEPIRQSIRAGMLKRNVPSLSVAVAQGGRILWEEGFGWADRERRVPADANTMYSLASISKPLTATGLMTLVRAGKIDLDAPINDYLGDQKLRAHIGDAHAATVRRIANHSAGLPEHFQFFYENEPQRAPSFDETIRRFATLVSIPGERFQYSNLGYGMLDYVISRVSGKSFAGYMRDDVFLKLGMTRTSVGTDPALAPYMAARYDGEDYVRIPPYQTDHDGASAIYSSAHDLVRFGMFSLAEHLPDQEAILSDAELAAMQTATSQDRPGVGYGIGWGIETTTGHRIVTHSGGMPGVATWLRMFPENDLVIVVLSNEDDRLAHTIADQITEVMVPGWKVPPPGPPGKPFVPSPELVGKWSGSVATYKSTTPITMEVFESGDIHVTIGDQLTTLLNRPSFAAEALRGMLSARIDLPETERRPYLLSVNLRLRDGNTLTGAITARADQQGTIYLPIFPAGGMLQVEREGFVLTQWCELRKQ